jgi:hypothetical protein
VCVAGILHWLDRLTVFQSVPTGSNPAELSGKLIDRRDALHMDRATKFASVKYELCACLVSTAHYCWFLRLDVYICNKVMTIRL